MAEDDTSEKTEQPTPYKLREAKKKGNVSKSNEFNSAVALIAGIFLLLAIGTSFIQGVLQLCAGLFAQVSSLPNTAIGLERFFGHWVSQAMGVLSPIVAVMFVTGILATIIQTGFVFSFHGLKPDLNRLNPVTGLKKLIDIRVLYEIVRSLIKLAVFVTVVGWTVLGHLPDILSVSHASISSLVPSFIGLAATLLFRLTAVLIVFAIIDLLFTRWQFMKKMKMSKKELKDEVKRREGDPMVRAKRRELERELRKRSQSAGSVPGADLIITNPTRYAIVIKYDRSTMAAPQVTGKGTGEMARVIRQEAARYGVAVESSPALARALYKKVKIDHAIGQDFFVDVAKLLRKVYREKSNAKSSMAM